MIFRMRRSDHPSRPGRTLAVFAQDLSEGGEDVKSISASQTVGQGYAAVLLLPR
jgi:hypothetical protein